MSSKQAMAEDIRRLKEKIRALEARDIEIEREADCADVVLQELMIEMKQKESSLKDVDNRQQNIENSLEEFQKVQYWMAGQIEYFLKRESLFEARISQLQEEVKSLREASSTAAPSQPAAKKMPRQPDGPPPKKAKAAAKAEAKAVSQPKIIVVKTKAATPAARRAEPSS